MSGATVEGPLAGRVLVAAAAALWAVLVPGQSGRFMDQPLRLPEWLASVRSRGPGLVARADARAARTAP